MYSRNLLKIIACLFVTTFPALGAFGIEIKPRDAWTTSKVQGKPTAPAPYRIEPAFPNLSFEKPTSVTEIPGTNRLFVTQQGGKIFSFKKERNVAAVSLVGDLGKLLGGVSINSAAFHPNYKENRFLFVCLVFGNGQSGVMRFTLSDSPEPKIVNGSRRLLISWPSGGHGGGCLQFGPDGYLYISTGDGSGPNPPDLLTTGQDITDLLGAVLRIDVNHESSALHYSIPRDNPFIDLKGARPEIWSYGLRNPWKFGIDQETGDVFVADNGWETWEMIHKLHRGSNCGWPIMESRARLRTEVKQGPTPITPPIKDHPHTEANSVIGGPVYRGKDLPDLNGTFVYGDYITGTIWGLKEGQEDEGLEHRTLVDTDLQIVAFTEGSRGEIYVLDYDRTGQLYLLLPSDEVDTSANFPRRLSNTGLFASTEKLTPAAGVIPYSVVSERWMDGAVAQRWVAVPGIDSIQLGAIDPLLSEFPEGTVFVKQVSLPSNKKQGKVRLETQLLHFENGAWNPYSYLWDEAGKDATLVESRGTDHTIRNADDPKLDRTWHVGSVNECRLCHNAAAGVVLGFTGKQLNRVLNDQERVHQFTSLTKQRVISKQPVISDGTPSFVDPHDSTATIDDRARSYLHTNCGMCHHRQGPATISFYTHRNYPFDQLKITKRPGIGTFGLQSPQLIAPGDPNRSIILYRMSKLGYGRMPYIGSQAVDSRGVDLIDTWIKSLRSKATSSSQQDGLLQAVTAKKNNRLSKNEIDELLKTTKGSLALATAMHRRQVSEVDMQYIRRSTVLMKSDIRGLFDHFLPESERRKTLGTNPDLDSVLDLAGNYNRGKLIFLSDNARCRSCHHVTDPSKSLGPTLSDIRNKYKQSSELLKHIITPAEKIDEKFTTWTVLTAEGNVLSGLLVSNDDQAVQLRLQDKSLIRIHRAVIEEMKKSDQSIMPAGALSDLTPQEAADLLSYLLNSDGNNEED